VIENERNTMELTGGKYRALEHTALTGLKMICNDFLVVKVNCPLYVFEY